MRQKPTAEQISIVNTQGFMTFDWEATRFTFSLNTDPEGAANFHLSEMGAPPMFCSIRGYLTTGPQPRAVVTDGAHPEPEFMLQLLKLMLGMMNLPDIGVATVTLTSEAGPN